MAITSAIDNGDTRVLTVTGATTSVTLQPAIGCGQAFTGAQVGISAAGSNDGVSVGVRVGVYADDGTGSAPMLGVVPLLDSGLIAIGASTGNQTATISFTEPVGDYWIGTVLQYTTAPGTFPTVITLSSPIMLPPAGVISSGTNANQARWLKATGASGALTTLSSVAQDQSSHAMVGLVV